MSRHLIATLILWAASLPALAAIDIQHWSTPNGARVLLVETHNLPMLDVQVDFAAGASRDPAGRNGVAALTHALLDAGSGSGREARDENALADLLADAGAILGGGIDDDRASIGLRVLSDPRQRAPALAVLRDILTRPAFPPAVLARERMRSIASLREARTQPDALLGEALAAAVYGEHPYGRSSSEASLRRIRRADLAEFHRRYYTARNALVTIVGDIDRASAEALATELLGGLPAGQEAPPLAAPAPPRGGLRKIPFAAEQAHIGIGSSAPARQTGDLIALQVGNHILGGGGFSSRLMKELRDARGLAYNVSSGFDAMTAGGDFEIRLETRADQAEAAIGVVRHTLEAFLRDGPDPAELAAAKASLIKSFALSLDSNAKLLAQVSEIGFHRRPLDSLATYPARIEAVTLEQLRAAFARHLKPDELVTVVVGGR